MKKVLFILSVVMSFSVLTSSCKKDSGSTTNPNDLTGTKWVNNSSASGLTIVETVSFTSASTYTDVAVLTGTTNATQTANGTYVYTPPTLKFTVNGTTGSGTINGNYLYAPSINGNAVVTYIKQ